LIARNADGELTVLAALAALTTLCAAGTCRQSRSKFREIDQAAKTARDTFDTRQQTLGVADH
jgi:hypothetical protein